jgi:hypothetical protein
MSYPCTVRTASLLASAAALLEDASVAVVAEADLNMDLEGKVPAVIEAAAVMEVEVALATTASKASDRGRFRTIEDSVPATRLISFAT